MTNKTSDQAESISADQEKQPKVRFDGNFPVDQYTWETFDPATGEMTFVKRVSNADRYLNKAGQEILDPRPAAPALGKKPEMHIRDYIRSLVMSEKLRQDLEAQGVETFEEANDFEVGEDYFPDSEYENDLEPSIAELIRTGNASLSAKARAEEVRKARLKDNADDPEETPHKPKKSPRRARRASADDAEAASDGDQSGGEADDPAD